MHERDAWHEMRDHIGFKYKQNSQWVELDLELFVKGLTSILEHVTDTQASQATLCFRIFACFWSSFTSD